MRNRLRLLAASMLLIAAVPGAAQGNAQAEGLARASVALKRGDGVAAEAELRKLIAAGAAKEVVAARMGEALIQQGDGYGAREWLGPGKFAKGDEVYGWRMLALLNRLDNNLGAAGWAYDQALKVNPKDSQLWVDIGRMRFLGGEQREAIAASEEAVKLDPGNVRALEFRAQLVRDQFGLEAALPWYEAALAKSPDDVDLLAGYAATLGDLGRANEMLTVTRRLIELSPGHPMAVQVQAVLAARAGENALARQILAKAGDRLYWVPASQLLRGALDLEAGNAAFAVEVLDKLVKRQPANRAAWVLLARAFYETGDYRELFYRFSGMAERADAPPYLLTLLARAHEEQGNREAAARLLDRAAKLGGAPYVALPDRAATRAGTSEAFSQAGDLALLGGNSQAALQNYTQASAIRFPDVLLLRIAEANDRSGRGSANPGLVFTYLAASPQSRMAARLGAGYAAAAGDWERSAALLTSLRGRGGARDARLLADLALAQLRGGDSDAALETARAAYHLQRMSPSACLAYAMALTANDQNLPLAEDLLAKTRALGGDSPMLAEARKALAAAKR